MIMNGTYSRVVPRNYMLDAVLAPGPIRIREFLISVTLTTYGAMNRMTSILKPLTLVRRFRVAFRPVWGKKHDASGTKLENVLLLTFVSTFRTSRMMHGALGPRMVSVYLMSGTSTSVTAHAINPCAFRTGGRKA